MGEKYPLNLIWIMPAKGSYRVYVRPHVRIFALLRWIADLQ